MDGPVTASQRLGLVDVARGIALLAMTLFHFCWDLAMFRLIDPQIMFEPGMIWFARSIAGSFLFLVGFSLFLAHGNGVRWRAWGTRWIQLLAAAGAITVATYLAFPDAFIFFGILHSIALGSLIGLAFLRLPAWLTLAAGLSVLLGGRFLRTAALDHPVWWWTGLSQVTPVSNDYVPLVPFFGMTLLGLAAARFMQQNGRLGLLAMSRPQADGRMVRMLGFIGRHSLVYYLLHQPVMLGLLFAVLTIIGRI